MNVRIVITSERCSASVAISCHTIMSDSPGARNLFIHLILQRTWLARYPSFSGWVVCKPDAKFYLAGELPQRVKPAWRQSFTGVLV
jgi:hypothetical protein